MKKPVYKLLDEKGRVLIPLEMRQKAEIEKGDILKVSINTGKIVISKVDILEVEALKNHSKRSMRSFMRERWIPSVWKMSGRSLAEGCQGILKDMHYPYPM